MKSTQHKKTGYLRAARLCIAFSLLGLVGLMSVSSAFGAASYEQIKTFACGPEPGFNEIIWDTAVNYTGGGGAAPGTVYEAVHASTPSPPNHVLECGSNGELLGVLPVPGDRTLRSIAVDQVTGDIFVRPDPVAKGSGAAIVVFEPGNPVPIEEFGEYAFKTESIASSPGELHEASDLAVAGDCTVYVADGGYLEAKEQGGQKGRVMSFSPEGSGCQNFKYTGTAKDLTGFPKFQGPAYLALDNAGNVYAGSEGAIERYSPSSVTPDCTFSLPAEGIRSIAVDPRNGEVFFDSYKDGKGHQLICEGNSFVSGPTFAITPKPTATFEVNGLSFDPNLKIGERPSGVLYAANALGTTYVFTRAEERPPVVEFETPSHVTSTSATLEAAINPKGSPTRYIFQYITAAAYQENDPADPFAGAMEAPQGGGPVGSAQESVGVTAALSSLVPDTEYHYRAIATSNCSLAEKEKVCEVVGPDQVFRTFPIEAPGLPDGRHWELVSPTQKNGGEAWPVNPGVYSCTNECKPGGFRNQFPRQSATDGEAVAYEGFPFSFTEGAVLENEYVSRRNAKTGWQTTILAPELMANGENQGYKAFNADLTQGVLYQVNPSLSPDAPGGYANLYAQSTATPDSLTPLLSLGAPTRPTGTSFKLTYAGASADFSRIFFEANDALTGATSFAPEAVDGGESKNNLYEWHEGRLTLVNVLPGNTETIPGAAFGSGTQLHSGNPNAPSSVVTNAISADGSRVFWSNAAGQVFVRIDGEYTEPIVDTGKYLAASADGSKVLLNDGCLYDVAEQECEDLTGGKGGFQGILGQSDDLSHLYFTDTAVLDETPNEQGAVAHAGERNLYAWDEGTVAFVVSGVGALGGESPVVRSSEVSPDGRWVTFLSEAPLTGYDNTGPCDAISGTGIFLPGPCKEVFLYDSATKRLTCASCNPSGETPLGPSNLALILGAEGSQQQPRYLSDSGRLFFDSQDSLSPLDTNGNGVQPGHSVEDVYEYEPKGVGNCGRATGCVRLISAGHEPIDSNFLASDEDGKNVFFTTRDELVLKDHDELIDVYDAREGTPIPGETETGRGECQGEACQQPVSPPNDPTPASSTFEGAGNVIEPKAAKKHAKKHKKKHAKKKHAHKRAAKHNRGGAK